MRRLVAAVLLVVGMAVSLAVAVQVPASAHATLISIDPAAGSTVSVRPAAVTLRFSEPVQPPVAVRVVGPAGELVSDGASAVLGDRVAQRLVSADTGPGEYTVRYQVLSSDGHVVTGTSKFEVASRPAGTAPVVHHTVVRPGVVVLALLLLLLLMLALAGVGRLTAIGAPDRRGVLLLGGAGLGAAVTVLALVLLLAGGAPHVLPGLPSASPVVLWLLDLMPLAHLVLGTATLACGLLVGGWLGEPTGGDRAIALTWLGAGVLTLVLLALQLTGIGVPAGELPSTPQATGAFLGVLVVGFLAYAAPTSPRSAAPLAVLGLLPSLLTGHVRTASPAWLAGVGLTVHVAAAVIWVGGLLAVSWLVLRQQPGWPSALRRFSWLAGWAVLALALSGLVTALTRVQSWSALATGYGVVVLLKVGALGVLVVLGARQRRGLAAGPRVDRRTFVALAGTELLVMALVFALAAGLAGTPPPA